MSTRNWHEINGAKRPVGRIATETATLLRGKHKETYTPHIDDGDFVIITNCEKVVFTGNKETDKRYYSYSGYPGSIRERKVADLKEQDPASVLRHAITGMMPKNKLTKLMLRRLKLVVGTEHEYAHHLQKNND